MLQFDAETTKILEAAYAGADFTQRRRMAFDALNPAPGDHIADIGCGNGTLLSELARTVGPDGLVIGVDPSRDMTDAARVRCAGMEQVRFEQGDTSALPLEDASVDKAVSLQVFEYIADVVPALTEIARILRPGGRFVIADLHFDTWVWHSDHPERMQVMMRDWGNHAAHWDLPQHLPGYLDEAGFEVDRVTPFTVVDHVMRADGYGALMIPLMSQYARQSGDISDAEIADWAAEQADLARQGRFFFSITQVVIAAAKRR